MLKSRRSFKERILDNVISLFISIFMMILWLIFYFLSFKRNRNRVINIYKLDKEVRKNFSRNITFNSFIDQFNFLGFELFKLFGEASAKEIEKIEIYWEMLNPASREKNGLNRLYDAISKYRDMFLILAITPFVLTNHILLFVLIGIVFLRYYYSFYRIKREASKLQKQVQLSILPVINRMVLSIRAGSLLQEAWEDTAKSNDGPLFKEMLRVEKLVSEGHSIKDAYREFGKSFRIESLKDMTGILLDSLSLGSIKLCEELETLREREVNRAKRALKQEADRAQEKMIFPGILLFVAILILVMAPMLAGTFYMN